MTWRVNKKPGFVSNMLKRFSAMDLILIAAFAAVGIAIKPIVGPFFKMISTPLGIPGGSFGGGFYLMWMVLAMVIVDKAYTGTLFGIIQAIGVLVMGMSGNQGAVSLISYTLPGILADLLYLGLRHRKNLYVQMTLCAFANALGALLTGIIIFKHPPIFLAGITGMALVSGIVGGILSFGIYKSIKELRII
ncbi:MAG: ECF transporter S component [Candidatus Cloacimonetes bacterium]|nr:ECF transporter S component [Candidatus Cloacimonadota bacterium]MDY0336713.1 ECF transporter S component [Candidatus Cloacimonadaceae bacterium]MCB5269192.1 ECF transporter S component [Candidatus Cloacimonadota bacterium]MCK9335305.1 ECF transporter S component [Candidatus Cloacimonadota bacterium]MDD2543871.1 ECF transporter S component [Candidatus Cloacimonadota bacterium]